MNKENLPPELALHIDALQAIAYFELLTAIDELHPEGSSPNADPISLPDFIRQNNLDLPGFPPHSEAPNQDITPADRLPNSEKAA